MSRVKQIGVASVTVAVLVVVVSVIGSDQQAEQINTLWFTVPFALLVGAFVYAWLVPWATSTANGTNRPARTGLVMSILGFLSIVAFWSGLPIILGTSGAALGRAGQARTAGRSWLGLAAMVVGVLAIVLGITAFALDRFS